MGQVKEISQEDLNKQNIFQSFLDWFSDQDKFSKLLVVFTFLVTISISTIGTGIITFQNHATDTSQIKKIIVYGGTPSGVIAAVTAARAGAKVILLEPTQHVGGMLSNGFDAIDFGNRNMLGGYTKEFFTRAQKESGTTDSRYRFQAHVAEKVFNDMLNDAKVQVELGQQLAEKNAVSKTGTTVTSVLTTTGATFNGNVFIDASYEGDLMKQAGVKYSLGRESINDYGEKLAGVQKATLVMNLKGVSKPAFLNPEPGAIGSSDTRLQESNYRICLSSDVNNQVGFTKPAGYNADNYSLIVPYLNQKAKALDKEAQLSWIISLAPLVNNDFDVNDSGSISTAIPGANWQYPEGSYLQRQNIIDFHKNYDQGLLWFLANDASVPALVKKQISTLGLCKDEFTDSNNWPRQLYIREGRRMVGAYVLSENDIEITNEKSDAIAVGSYRIDSHDVSLFAKNDNLYTEGFITNPYLNYDIPYRIITPQSAQVTNLLVPVDASATHVAWGSLRTEPQFMMLGEASGQAAALALDTETTVQDINIATLQRQLTDHGVILSLKNQAIPTPTKSPEQAPSGLQTSVSCTSAIGANGQFAAGQEATGVANVTFSWNKVINALSYNLIYTYKNPQGTDVAGTFNVPQSADSIVKYRVPLDSNPTCNTKDCGLPYNLHVDSWSIAPIYSNNQIGKKTTNNSGFNTLICEAPSALNVKLNSCTNGLADLTFNWNNLANANYNLSYNLNNDNKVIIKNLSANSYDLQVKSDSKVDWFVAAVGQSGQESPYSSYANSYNVPASACNQ